MSFVSGSEAAVSRSALIISDLHIGMDASLFSRGIRMGGLADFLARKTISLLKKTRRRRLVILGDVKENVVSTGFEVRSYFSSVSPHAEVIVCKGNHDGNMERVPGISVAGPGGIVLDGIGMLHGHAWPGPGLMGCETILMGHNHPQLTFFESGKREPRPVWLFCPASQEKISGRYPRHHPSPRLAIMPPFNPLLGNEIGKFGGLGPLLRNGLFSWERASVFTLGGTRLGEAGEIARASFSGK